jgi:hypothetical protein
MAGELAEPMRVSINTTCSLVDVRGGGHLEQSVEKGYVVGPFLEGSVELGEDLLDTGSVSSGSFVLGRSLFCGGN